MTIARTLDMKGIENIARASTWMAPGMEQSDLSRKDSNTRATRVAGSVVCYNEKDISPYVDPPVTAVKQSPQISRYTTRLQ